jgi:hypothetical protein
MTHLQRYQTERYKFIGRTVDQTQACHYIQESKKSAYTNNIQQSTFCKHNHGCHPLRKLWAQKYCDMRAQSRKLGFSNLNSQPLLGNGLVNMPPWQQTCTCSKINAAGSGVFCEVHPETEEDYYPSLRLLRDSHPLAEASPMLEATVYQWLVNTQQAQCVLH